MIVEKIIGNRKSYHPGNRGRETILVEWFELSKRILHKKSDRGREIRCRFLIENHEIKDGDVLFEDENIYITAEVKSCEMIVIKPSTMVQMATVAYEIGNKHLPLFIEGNVLMIPYEAGIFKTLAASGISIGIEERKPADRVRTTVVPHGETSSEGLLTKILNLTSSKKNE